ncbi:Hat2p NDAI_0K02900 [Naumovozyma dairenensis CBS 421]|uniref:Histone-binding protein RBBP4-like N-terminal domain-containing protein n=1 Tax=Naumovozyma dairenensis (strain ATCC 10597 / BCRC 20456 / CBS 421 / NBRC 0211 / NRRL Y-12639) TaxID=1071378 RepID=G0WI70_NAUDC|nr:hypothetical protein NDAI_0K02900 [Naumovozyma dairenensis CBS 421]CCD27481.1 hypothetical protein NDAI_0K02900 [Naumovozyma dairenensis CBS 421]
MDQANAKLLEKLAADPSMLAQLTNQEETGNGDENKELTIDEEYDLWKSNVPLMYDFVSETKLTWPTLTVEWLPSSHSSTPVSNRQELILGTHTSGEEDNYLKIAAIDLPDEVVQPSTNSLKAQREDDEDEDDQKQKPRSNIKIVKKFKHEEEITRARFMPQNTDIIATINGSGTVFIYNQSNDKQSALISTLRFHKENGYGLSFNPNDKGKLLSGSDDGTIALWDIQENSTLAKKPLKIWDSVHNDIVNDCKWNEFNSNVFASVSEDSTLQLHDQREQNTIINSIKTTDPFNTLAFSKHSQYLMAAAGTDSLVYLYDSRNLSVPLYSMNGHEDSITNLEFSPHTDGVLISSGNDRRVIMWDINDIGAEQIPDDAEDGAPEVIMIHAGHRSAVNDFSINPNIPWLMASAEEENIIQVWKCSHKLPIVGGTPEVSVSILE